MASRMEERTSGKALHICWHRADDDDDDDAKPIAEAARKTTQQGNEIKTKRSETM